MAIKKSKFSYFVWFLFLIISFGMIYQSSYGISSKFENAGDMVFLGASFGAIIFVIIFILILSNLINRIKKGKVSLNNESFAFMQILYLLFGIVLLVMTRVIYITFSGNGIVGDNFIYECANKKMDVRPADTSVGVAAYTRLIRFLLFNIGSKNIVVSYFNIAIQIITFICIFFLVKNMIGTLAAAVASSIYIFVPTIFTNINAVDTQNLIIMLIMLSMSLFACVCRGLNSKKYDVKKIMIYSLLSGLFAGVAGFFNIQGLLLIVFSISLAAIIKLDKDSKIKALHISLLFIAGMIISYGVCMYLEASSWHVNVFDMVTCEYKNMFSAIDFNENFVSPGYEDYLSVILIAFSSLYLFRIFNINRDLGSYYIFYCILVSLVSVFNIGSANSGYIITSLWCVLCGIGFASLSNVTYEDAVSVIESKALSESNTDKKTVADNKADSSSLKESSLKENEKMEKDTSINNIELDFLKEKSEQSLVIIKEGDVDSKPSRIFSADELEVNDEDENGSDSADELMDISSNINVGNTEDTSTLESSTETEEIKKEAVEVQKPADVVIPTVKYGRRMDYKTAIVKSSSNHSSLDKLSTVNNAIKDNIINKPVNNSSQADIESSDVKTDIIKNDVSIIKNDTVNDKSKPIHNPLPVPKKTISREMDFDVIPSSLDMHFDIVDMKGKDFFDIN